MTAELVAEKYEVTREQQDDVRGAEPAACGRRDSRRASSRPRRSRSRSRVARATSRCSIRDEGPRADDERLKVFAKLKPVFKRRWWYGHGRQRFDDQRRCLARSSSWTKTLRSRKRLSIRLARILGYATGGMAPEWVMMAPEDRCRQSLCTDRYRRSGLRSDRAQRGLCFAGGRVDACARTSIPTSSTCTAARSRSVIRSVARVHGCLTTLAARVEVIAAKRSEGSPDCVSVAATRSRWP